MGQPFIYVVDANYLNRGELYLAHQFAGLEVDSAKAVEVLRAIRVLWGRPVHLQARFNEEMHLVSMEGVDDKPKRERINEDTPKPAHVIE
jgi:stage V sporulation protein R